MKSALYAHLKDNNNWVGVLLVVLLGIRSTPKEDLAHSPAQLVYGTPLHLTGKLSLSTNTPEPTGDNFLSQLCANLRTLHPQPVTWHGTPATYVSKELQMATRVFVQHNMYATPLQCPYNGPPFKVLV